MDFIDFVALFYFLVSTPFTLLGAVFAYALAVAWWAMREEHRKRNLHD